MTTHVTGTHEQWLRARLELLEAEKELTRRSDELARRRLELPWVRVDKEYRFETDAGGGVWWCRVSVACARRPSRSLFFVGPRARWGGVLLPSLGGFPRRLRR